MSLRKNPEETESKNWTIRTENEFVLWNIEIG